jgi:hypothetical protein
MFVPPSTRRKRGTFHLPQLVLVDGTQSPIIRRTGFKSSRVIGSSIVPFVPSIISSTARLTPKRSTGEEVEGTT